MRRGSALAYLLATALLAGCHYESPTAPYKPLSLVGNWNLVSIDGQGLPFTIQGTYPVVELVSGAIRFDRDPGSTIQQFTESTTRKANDRLELRTGGGVWSGYDGTAQLSWGDGLLATATFSARTLTIVVEGPEPTVLVYGR